MYEEKDDAKSPRFKEDKPKEEVGERKAHKVIKVMSLLYF